MQLRPQSGGVFETGNARIAIVTAQAARLDEFGGGTLAIACQCIGGCKPGARPRQPRIGVARPFEPGDRVVDARFQQMDHADPPTPIRQARITWAETDRLLLSRDRLLDRTSEKLA